VPKNKTTISLVEKKTILRYLVNNRKKELGGNTTPLPLYFLSFPKEQTNRRKYELENFLTLLLLSSRAKNNKFSRLFSSLRPNLLPGLWQEQL
jgi:hypothetical protein